MRHCPFHYVNPWWLGMQCTADAVFNVCLQVSVPLPFMFIEALSGLIFSQAAVVTAGVLEVRIWWHCTSLQHLRFFAGITIRTTEFIVMM